MAAGGKKEKGFFGHALTAWTHDGAEHFSKWLTGWMFDPTVVVPPAFIALLFFAHAVDPDATLATWATLVAFSPIWLPFALFVLFWITWVHYIRFAFWFSPVVDSVLLEIELPPEVEKTPLAMETFFSALWQSGGETTFIQRVWKGQMRLVNTLEIASIEGRLHFYIHTRRSWKNIIESRLYGQFPEARVFEVEDYLSKIPSSLKGYGLWGSEYQKSEPQALPIKTYIDYELNKSPDKPEITVDPITNILELMGSIGKDEYFWMQIHTRARKPRGDEWYGFYLSKDGYVERAKAGIKEITETAIERARELTPDEMEQKKVGSRGAMLMTETEKRKVEAIERSMGKLLFECGVRVCYAAKEERFVPVNISNIVTFFAGFRSMGLTNSLGVTRGLAYFDYPWQDVLDYRKTKEQHNLYFRSKHRAYFGVPYDQVPVFMTTEELASIWHFPSSVVKTPGLSRVPAKVSEAPVNLPV